MIRLEIFADPRVRLLPSGGPKTSPDEPRNSEGLGGTFFFSPEIGRYTPEEAEFILSDPEWYPDETVREASVLMMKRVASEE